MVGNVSVEGRRQHTAKKSGKQIKRDDSHSNAIEVEIPKKQTQESIEELDEDDKYSKPIQGQRMHFKKESK